MAFWDQDEIVTPADEGEGEKSPAPEKAQKPSLPPAPAAKKQPDGKERAVNPWDSDRISPKEPTMGEYIGGFSGGIGEGLTTVLGAPTDITSSILRKLGIVQEEAATPFGGKESLKRGFEAAGFGFPKGPDTTGGRILHRAGEELGSAALPGGLLFKKALMAPKIAASASALGVSAWARRVFLDPIKAAPGTAALQDIASTTTSGLGAGVAQEIAPGSKTGETAGQVAGGALPFAAGYGPTGLVVKALKSLSGRFSSKAQMEAARRAVEGVMGGSLDAEALRQINAAQKLTQKTRGTFRPSVAESSKVPALVAIQRQIEKEASEDFLNALSKRRSGNMQAIESYSRRVAPQGESSPEIIIDAANQRINVVGAKVEKMAAETVQKKRDIASGLPTIDKIGAGEALRESVYRARAEASTKMSLAAEELGIAGIDMTAAYESWKQAIVKKYRPSSRFDDPAAIPEMVKIIAKDKAERTTFSDIKSLRERVSDDLIDELSAANPSRRKVRALTLLKKDVDEFIEQAGGEGGNALKEFRKLYFEEYIKPFETGAMFKARNKDGTGFFRSRDEQIAGVFIDNPSAARQFRTVFGDQTDAMKTLEDAFLDKLRSATALDGVIDEKKLKTFVAHNKDVLKELPSLQGKVSTLQATQSALIARQGQLASRKAAIENSALAKQLARYEKGAITADKVLDDALQDPRKMGQLKIFVRRDPDALAALTRTVWDKASQGDAADVLKYLAKHEKSLKVLLSPQHFNDIQDITAMKSMMDILPTPQGVANMPSPMEAIEKMIGMKVPQASTRWYALMTGRLSKSYLMADISRAIIYSKGRANIEALLRDALYDPDVARIMASAVHTGTFTEAIGRRVSARLFALGLPYVRDVTEDGEGKQMTSAPQRGGQ